MNNSNIRREKDYTYDQLLQLREHAKQYNFQSDKKLFLKQIPTLEQKMILLSSSNPYEVMANLDELNSPQTTIMLSELKTEEIINLLSKFSSEDKRNFYATFSQKNLVNRFIEHDTKAFNHVPELNIERKAELLNSSNMSTKEAAEVIYSSISVEDRAEVVNSVTNVDATNVLDSVSSSNETPTNNISENESDNNEIVEDVIDVVEEVQAVEEPEQKQDELPKLEEQPNKENQKDELVQPLTTVGTYDVVDQPPEEVNLLEQFQQAKEMCEAECISSVTNFVQQKMCENNTKVI